MLVSNRTLKRRRRPAASLACAPFPTTHRLTRRDAARRRLRVEMPFRSRTQRRPGIWLDVDPEIDYPYGLRDLAPSRRSLRTARFGGEKVEGARSLVAIGFSLHAARKSPCMRARRDRNTPPAPDRSASRRLDCLGGAEMQGFLFARPRPAADLRRLSRPAPNPSAATLGAAG